MVSAEGRRFVYDFIFRRCGLMDVYPAQDSGIYRHEGRRQLGVELAQELQRDHTDQYVLMVTERMQDQTKESVTRETDNDQPGDDE